MKSLVPKKIKDVIHTFGPGVITGAADDDPSGIATYSQTGSQFGYSQLWLFLFSLPFITVVQEMCGRIGVVTGTGIAGIMKKHYSKKVLYASVMLLLVANIINIGADLGAMAASAQLIFGLPFIVWLTIFTILTIVLEVFISYKNYSRFLKYLCFSLLAYVITGSIVHQDWGQIIKSTFIPSFSIDKEYVLNIVAVLGTTISPYLFFWQTNEEVEEEIEYKLIVDDGVGKPKVTEKNIKDMQIDTFSGMAFSQIIMFFIIITAASTLFVHGIHTIDSPQAAAQALRPFAGDLAYLVFTLGIVGTGLLAIPILATSASYAVAETFEFKRGLSKSFKQAPTFYGIIIFATLFGFAINFIGINPIQALYFSAVMNGLLAPPLLIVILFISNNRKIMYGHTNNKISNILGILIAFIMSFAALVLIFSLFL